MNIVKNELSYLYEAYKQYALHKKTYRKEEKYDNKLDAFFELSCFHYTQVKLINDCNSDIIVINNDTESLHSKEYFKQYNNSKFYVIISADAWEAKKHDIGIDRYVNIAHWFDIFDLINRNLSFYNFEFWLDKEYVFENEKKYKFLSLIGSERPERDLFFNILMNRIGFNNSIVRYSGQNYGEENNLDVHYNRPGEFDPYSDIKGIEFHNVSNTIPIDLYNQANFQVVVETDINLENFAPTEKIYKSLLTGMPFVVLGSYKFLSNIRSLGFTTYNELWDESYDNIYHFENRINKVCDTIKNLESFDWENNKSKLEIIAAKNARNFLNCNNHLVRFFKNLEKVVKEFNI